MIVKGWFDWTVVEEGPPERSVYFHNAQTSMEVVIHHSLEGYHRPSGYRVFKDILRFPTAWHWTVGYNGTLYQHYDIRLRLQHAHNGNTLGPGGESEGFKGSPLTDAQVETWLRIHEDIREFTGRDYRRDPKAQYRLVEHNEVAGRNFWGTKKTQCPSGRYEPLWTRLEEAVGDLSDDLARLNRRTDAIAKALGGWDAIGQWNENENSLFKGYAIEQAEQNSIEGDVEALKKLHHEHLED